MPSLLRDWKPGKRLSARARRAALKLGHCLPKFRPSPYEAADEVETYFAECKRCGHGVILDFHDPNNYTFWGPALNWECRGRR
jgi:ribosomal protein S27AE